MRLNPVQRNRRCKAYCSAAPAWTAIYGTHEASNSAGGEPCALRSDHAALRLEVLPALADEINRLVSFGRSSLPQTVNLVLEEYTGGPSQPFHLAGPNYKYRQAASLTDAPAKLTARQGVFYRNFIRIAESLLSQELPLDFIDANGSHLAMDLGCVKIAEHAGFIRPLVDGSDNVVKSIHLAWSVRPN